MAFIAGVIAGASLSCAALLVWRARVDAVVEAEVSFLKQSFSRADHAAREAQKELRAARESLSAGRTRDALLPPAQSMRASTTSPPMAPGNAAIINYLGDPVSAPATLDPKYSATEALAVFGSLCAARGIKIEKLAVDATEFPFVLHGVLENGSDFFQHIDTEVRALPGYSYEGSSTGRSRSGRMYFSLNITPSSAYPREQSEAIDRRVMLRLQMISSAWADSLR